MKLLCSLLLLTVNVQARDLFLITHDNDQKKAQEVKKVYIEVLEIPKSMIKVREKENPCTPNKKSIFHTCIKDTEVFSIYSNGHTAQNFIKLIAGEKNDWP